MIVVGLCCSAESKLLSDQTLSISGKVCDEQTDLDPSLSLNQSFQGPPFLLSPLFQCLICGQSIERSMRSYWKRKGHLLCSTCRDQIDSGEESRDFDPLDQLNHQG